MWRRAENGDSDFMPVFFPWWQNPEYEMEAPDGFTLDDEERFYEETYPEITKNKLAWRRYKIRNEMGGSALLDPVLQFKQEYPASPEEAFITSGRRVFDPVIVTKDIERAKQVPFMRGLIDADGKFRRHPKGPFKFYQRPKYQKTYAIGADVAEGLETGDYSAAFVIDKQWNQVVSYHNHIAPDLFGLDLCRLGKRYNRALLAPEMNNHGHATLAKIKDLGYGNLYTRKVVSERAEKFTKKLGWITSKASKMRMLDDFSALYRDRALTINDPELLKEMLALTVEPDGSINLGGKDRVVSACIAIQAIKQAHGSAWEALYPEKPTNRFLTLQDKLDWLDGLGKTNESYFD